MKYSMAFTTIVTVACMFALAGCKAGQYMELGPQSHFDYPNSNVKALAPVKVKVPGHTCVLIGFPNPTAEDDLKAYNAAIAQVDGANMITDYIMVYTFYSVPFVSWSEITLEGTAAKMEVGQQELR